MQHNSDESTVVLNDEHNECNSQNQPATRSDQDLLVVLKKIALEI